VLEVSVRDFMEGESLRQPEGVTMLDADKVAFPLVARGWREGDWMRPLGVHGRKKISDMLVDLHIPLHEKPSMVVLQDSHDPARVLSLLGRRIDESVRVEPGRTRRVVVLSLRRPSDF